MSGEQCKEAIHKLRVQEEDVRKRLSLMPLPQPDISQTSILISDSRDAFDLAPSAFRQQLEGELNDLQGWLSILGTSCKRTS